MFEISEQIESILAKLAEIPGVNQVELSEFVDNIESRPRILPCLILLPPSGKPKGPENATVVADQSWTVMIAAKNVRGALGHGVLMDAVLDTLDGFQPVDGVRPLSPAEWGMTNERVGEAAFASYVTFTTVQMAATTWNA